MNDKPHITRTDKLCALLLVGCFLAPNLAVMAMDEAAIRAAESAEADKPPAVTDTAPAIDYADFLAAHREAVEAVQDATREATETSTDGFDWEGVPLDQECREALLEACEACNVPLCDALGLIEVESGFNPNAVNGVCYGLCQLHTGYFPSDLTPAENIQAGVAYLGELMEKYDGDTQAALRAYNRGFDDGDRVYARAVLDASEKYGKG